MSEDEGDQEAESVVDCMAVARLHVHGEHGVGSRPATATNAYRTGARVPA